MDEESETQTTGEESQPETIGELLNGTEETEETKVDETEETEEVDKEEKKERDFEKGMHKFRDLYKEEKTKREALESKPVETADNKEAIDILRGIVDEAIAPLKEDRVWDDFEKRPYVDILKPEIMQELDKIPDGKLEERLEQARKNAIANNLDTIIKTSKEMGKEEAYSSQDVKSRQAGVGNSARKGETKSLLDRIKSGELSDQDWKENAQEIDKVMKDEIY